MRIEAEEMLELAKSLENEAAYLAKFVDINENIVDTVTVQYTIQELYETAQFLRTRSLLRAQVAMALLGDEIDD